MNISVNGAFVYFTIPIFGGIPITQTMLSCLIVSIVLMVAAIKLGKNIQKRPGGIQVLVEKGVMMMHNMVLETMGSHNGKWTPFIITIFLSSICGTLIGLTGFLRSTTADLSCVLVWALMVTGIIWYQSIKHNGFGGWLKGFTEPIVVMTPMNIISEIAQPFSMAFRHFGNVAGGGVITGVLYAALSMATSALLKAITGTIVIPIALALIGIYLFVSGIQKKKTVKKIAGIAILVISIYGALQMYGLLFGEEIPLLAFGIPGLLSIYFDLFSGFVQALVFTLLTMVYIAGACPPPEDKHPNL
jgi:F-type H+-transporting ATPase subunit a